MIVVRQATESDREILLEWRNDPAARAASPLPDEVSPDEHDAWFHRTLHDPQHHLFLGELDGEAMGMVRFDREDGQAEVSINVNPRFRGRGLARELLSSSIARLAEEAPAPAPALVARIRSDNLASLRIFAELHFLPTSRREGDFVVVQRPADAPVPGAEPD